ncbi:MAG: hypothetical protein KC618_02695 [Candidatus Omnitrophica bacterium]|nr:hypothetical protein [Candidatus Omnitrophota bacterium]
MKVAVKKVDSVKRELSFEIPKDRVSKTLDEVYKEIGKVAKVKGFRPGKAPRHVLEAQHGKTAREELMRKLIPEVYQEGIEKEQLDPIDAPEINDVKFQDGIITFQAVLDLKPEIKVKDYKGLKIKRKSSKVTDEEINKTLEYFKQGQGKDKEVAIDDAFAKGLGYPSLEEFKQSLARQLEMDKDRQNKFDVENQVIEQLLKKTKFDVPQSLVKRQLERRVHDESHRMQQQGVLKEEVEKNQETMRKELKEPVERDVKAYLVLDQIAKEEKIEVKEGENLPAKVMEFLLKEANWEEAK